LEGDFDGELEAFGGAHEMNAFYENQLQEELDDESLELQSVTPGLSSILIKATISHSGLFTWLSTKVSSSEEPLKIIERKVESLEIDQLCHIKYPTPWLLNRIVPQRQCQLPIVENEPSTHRPVRDSRSKAQWMDQYFGEGWAAKPEFVENLRRLRLILLLIL
jgi:hypothetical protein